MRDPERIKKILPLLEKYWTANPDLRLCQILGNITRTVVQCSYCLGSGRYKMVPEYAEKCPRCLGYGFVPINNYNVEDDVLITALEVLLELRPNETKVD